MHFRVWNCLNSDLNFTEVCSKGPTNNIPASVQIMAWRRPGDKPLCEPMIVRLPTHIYVTRPQWVNKLTKMLNSNLVISVLAYGLSFNVTMTLPGTGLDYQMGEYLQSWPEVVTKMADEISRNIAAFRVWKSRGLSCGLIAVCSITISVISLLIAETKMTSSRRSRNN